MSKCAGITRNGERCTTAAAPGSDYCYLHDPARADERRRNASKAARSRLGSEIRDIKRHVRDVIEGVLEGRIERGSGAVIFQGYNTLLKAHEQERRIKETEDLEARIEALERTQEGRAWRGAS